MEAKYPHVEAKYPHVEAKYPHVEAKCGGKATVGAFLYAILVLF